MKLNRFQKFVARVCKIVPFDIEQALRDAYRKGKEATEQKYAERTLVWVDPTVRAKAYEQSNWYDPDKNTDKPQVPHGIRERAMLHQLQERPGTFARVHAEMQRKKMQTVKLDPDTMMLPAATAPEDDWTNGGADKTARHQATKP